MAVTPLAIVAVLPTFGQWVLLPYWVPRRNTRIPQDPSLIRLFSCGHCVTADPGGDIEDRYPGDV